MQYFVFAVLSTFGWNLLAATQIECAVEQPCLWVNNDVNPSREPLGYCITKILGDETKLVLTRADTKGVVIDEVELPISEYSESKIFASSADGSIDLKTRKYNDFFAGNLKVASTNGAYGYFVTCVHR